MTNDTLLRDHLKRLLAWEDAHVGFEAAVADMPVTARGVRPPNMPYSAWELLEHIRIAQEDILDFCINASYRQMKWPDDYWPASPAPPDDRAWDESIRRYRRDLRALQDMAGNTKLDLGSKIPHGSGQTYLRELLLVADHTAYHVGQIVLVRRALGAWK